MGEVIGLKGFVADISQYTNEHSSFGVHHVIKFHILRVRLFALAATSGTDSRRQAKCSSPQFVLRQRAIVVAAFALSLAGPDHIAALIYRAAELPGCTGTLIWK
jgi:hypothetical protein